MSSVFTPIIDAINSGSPTKLNQALSSPVIMSTLQCRSVYLQMKQMYLLTVLVAIRRIHSLLEEMGLDNSRMEIKCIAQVVKTLDEEACGNNHNRNNQDAAAQDDDNTDYSPTISKNNTTNNSDDSDDSDNLQLIVDIGQLIQLGWLKGYVAFEHGILVLSKANAFPRRIIA